MSQELSQKAEFCVPGAQQCHRGTIVPQGYGDMGMKARVKEQVSESKIRIYFGFEMNSAFSFF